MRLNRGAGILLALFLSGELMNLSQVADELIRQVIKENATSGIAIVEYGGTLEGYCLELTFRPMTENDFKVSSKPDTLQ